MSDATQAASRRNAPISMSPDAFREAGHDLIDRIADFYAAMPAGAVTPGETPVAVRRALGGDNLPDGGKEPHALLSETADLLFRHSLNNGHPRFLGFITSSAAPIGALADMLAASVNPNLADGICRPWRLR